QRGVDRSFVQLQQVLADLFKPPRNSVAVQWAQDVERFQDHQVQRALKNFRLTLLHSCSFVMCKGTSHTPLECPNERFVYRSGGCRIRSAFQDAWGNQKLMNQTWGDRPDVRRSRSDVLN